MNRYSHSTSSDSSKLPSPDVQAYWDSKVTLRFSHLDHLSTRSSSQELTAARHAIDDELSALDATMRHMRARRNDFSPISRLPLEILSCIFALHAINQPPLGQDHTYHPYDINHWDRNHNCNCKRHRHPGPPSSLTPVQLALGWITVTHVSHHWRQVALSYPKLWVNIAFDLGAEWVEEMLERSKPAPISYCRELSSRQKKTVKKAWEGKALYEITLRKHLSHLRRLKVSGDWNFFTATFRALTLPIPHLESLELVCIAISSRELGVILPSDVFSRQAPKLRHITLVGCSIPWDSYLLCNLTHLEVRIPSPSAFWRPFEVDETDRFTIPSMDRLLSIFEAMPSLQVLTLGNCLPRPDFTNRVVPLRCLTQLSLEGLLTQAVAILNQVSLMRSSLLSLRCSEPHLTNGQNGNFDALINLITTHFLAPGTSVPSLYTLSIDYVKNEQAIRIVAWDKDISLHLPRSESIPTEPARLRLTLGYVFKLHAGFLSLHLCKALPLKNLRAFSVYVRVFWTTADWAELSRLCPEVAHLRVDESGAATLVHALMESTAFPVLVTLGFKNVDFDNTSGPGDHVALCDSLPVLLRSRRDAGVPVRRLELVACLYSNWDVCLEFVDAVACDGYLNEEEDSDSDSEYLVISDYSTAMG